MALEQYFFSVSLRGSIVRWFRVFAFSLAHEFVDFPVNDVSAPRHTEKDEQSDEHAPGSQPLVDGPTDEKAEGDAPGHGQADLHDNGHILSPVPIFAIIEKLFSSRFNLPFKPPVVHPVAQILMGSEPKKAFEE